MSAADRLPQTQFGSLKFPGQVWRLKMAGRHHVHEYPHSPGGAPEKLGRGLVYVSVRAAFHDRFPAYPNLYPQGMQQLFAYAQQEATLQFTHPSAGAFPAFIVNWDQQKDAKVRSGETVDIDFLEDQESSFALAAIATPASSASLTPSASQLARDLASIKAQLALTKSDLDLFDSLQNAVNVVDGFSDTKKLYGNRYATALQNVVGLCSQVDRLSSMQDARAWPVIDDLRDLWSKTVSVAKDLQDQRVNLQKYTVPRTMTLAEIANTLYGDTSRMGDLLSLNADAVTNPMRVLAGTTIRYYSLTPSQRLALAA